jgi:hypothetical protein
LKRLEVLLGSLDWIACLALDFFGLELTVCGFHCSGVDLISLHCIQHLACFWGGGFYDNMILNRSTAMGENKTVAVSLLRSIPDEFRIQFDFLTVLALI